MSCQFFSDTGSHFHKSWEKIWSEREKSMWLMKTEIKSKFIYPAVSIQIVGKTLHLSNLYGQWYWKMQELKKIATFQLSSVVKLIFLGIFSGLKCRLQKINLIIESWLWEKELPLGQVCVLLPSPESWRWFQLSSPESLGHVSWSSPSDTWHWPNHRQVCYTSIWY